MNSEALERLLYVMERLRSPEGGCPWDREQTYATIAPYTIEEAYEVADAISRNDFVELREELGDLLFQVVFHSQMAREEGRFDFDDVARAIVEKMIRRHPHVFADAHYGDAEEQTEAWEALKAQERMDKGKHSGSRLDGVTVGLPALSRAHKLQRKAAKAGFDWDSIEGVFNKVNEEVEEIREALADGDGYDRLEEELGDLLFSVVNLARHLKVDPEGALRNANMKFENRFKGVEKLLEQRGEEMESCDAAYLDQLWNQVKGDRSSS